MRRTSVMALVALGVLMMPAISAAQTGQAPAQAPVQAPAQSGEELDLQTVLAEPDFTLGALPTTLRLPKNKMAFRITHRFTYKINDNSFGEFFENFFGFDSSATIGFELRYGLANGTQLAVHRTNSKNIQFLAQHQLQAQRDNGKYSLDFLGGVEGQDNFTEEHSIVVGGVVSHQFTDQGSVYLQPYGVFNVTPEIPTSDRKTFVLGMGARFLIFKTRSSYFVAEFAPRLAGYDGGKSLLLFGLESRKGGHIFQLNVSNGFGTTLTQVGHGGPSQQHWHLGFNITRKFY
jgi:hypothetical protein